MSDETTIASDSNAGSPWRQQPGEPNRWFARFEQFRLAGPERTLIAVYRGYLDRREGGPRRTKADAVVRRLSVPAGWDAIAVRWKWRERAESFDRAERDRTRAADEGRYRKELEEHRHNCRTLARAELLTAAKMLAVAEKRLSTLKPEDLTPEALPAILRAIAAISDAGLSAEAQTLGIEHVMRQLLDAERDGVTIRAG